MEKDKNNLAGTPPDQILAASKIYEKVCEDNSTLEPNIGVLQSRKIIRAEFSTIVIDAKD